MTAPFSALDASVAYEDYRADVRDSLRIRAYAEVGRRLDARIDVAGGVVVDKRHNAGYVDERTRASQGLTYHSRVVNASFTWRY